MQSSVNKLMRIIMKEEKQSSFPVHDIILDIVVSILPGGIACIGGCCRSDFG